MAAIVQFTYRNFLMAYAVWWGCWIGLQTTAVVLTSSIGIELAILTTVTGNSILALAGLGMINLQRYYRPRFIIQLIWSLLISAGATFLGIEAIKSVTNNKPELLDLLQNTFHILFLFAWFIISLSGIFSWFWFYTNELRLNEVRKQDLEKLAREAELSRLRLQLQPHFLFNSLNSISALVALNPDRARTMIQNLSDFLRGTIKREDQDLFPVEEELNHLHLYLEIEKVRFGHRLQTSFHLEAEAKTLKIPPLMLQPVVENAIKFGLYDTLEPVTIRIEVTVVQGMLQVLIQNPFDPATRISKPGTGFGLPSIHRRLYLVYGRNDLLVTTTNGNIFTTTLSIPQNI